MKTACRIRPPIFWGSPASIKFVSITLPYLRRTPISVFFAVFTMTITDYGMPLSIGGMQGTLSVLMYNKAVGLLDYGTGSAVGTFLLMPAVITFMVDLFNPENSQGAFVTEPVRPEKKPGRDAAAYLFCALLSLCVLMPVAAFCMMAFETKYPVNAAFTLYHIEKTINRGAGEYFVNSLLYAVFTGFTGTAAAFVCSYLTARTHGKFVQGCTCFP